MRSIRLLPVLVLAASALLVLKTVGIVTGGGYTLTGVSFAQAQEQEGDSTEADQEGYSAEQLAAADAAADALFGGPRADRELENIDYYQLDGSGYDSPLASGASSTEDIILQRLSERRQELDALAGELETRMAIVEAAEMRLEERMAEIAAVEDRINSLVDAQEAEKAEHFESVVAMYATMRPADAATIFNDLDIDVLTRLGRAMNPRVLGPIVARMTPERAQQLTIRLAVNEDMPPAQPAPGPEFSHLPQIMGE